MSGNKRGRIEKCTHLIWGEHQGPSSLRHDFPGKKSVCQTSIRSVKASGRRGGGGRLMLGEHEHQTVLDAGARCTLWLTTGQRKKVLWMHRSFFLKVSNLPPPP